MFLFFVYLHSNVTHCIQDSFPGLDGKSRPRPPDPPTPTFITADGSFIRAVAAVHLAVADLVGGEADRGVVGTGILGGLAGSRLAGLFIRLVLAVNVAVAHPALGDALACRRDVQQGKSCLVRVLTAQGK